jgi:hypothetical protein
MLITPEAGPRWRWITVLTDAPLPVTGTSLMKSVVIVVNVWTYVRSLHSPVQLSMRMNLEKYVTMRENVKNILMKVKNGVFVDCVFISALMGEIINKCPYTL